MITKQDVAERAGVSTATVGRVISGKGYVSSETRERVEKTIEELHYRPNRLASNLRKRRGNLIAVLVEDLLNPYYMHLTEAMVERAGEKDYLVSFFPVSPENMKRVLDDLFANRVCGIVNLAMFNAELSVYKAFVDSGVRLINCIEGGVQIQVDYTVGMREAMTFLFENGHKRVAFVVGIGEELAKKDMRVCFYRENRSRFGFSEDEDLIVYGNYPKERAPKVGYDLCGGLLTAGVGFDAVFCLTDMMAMGAIRALNEKGFSVPDDVSVIGCDNLDFTDYFSPPLTTVAVDKRAEGYAYVDYVADSRPESEIQKEKIVIPTSLVHRRSVAPCASAKKGD